MASLAPSPASTSPVCAGEGTSGGWRFCLGEASGRHVGQKKRAGRERRGLLAQTAGAGQAHGRSKGLFSCSHVCQLRRVQDAAGTIPGLRRPAGWRGARCLRGRRPVRGAAGGRHACPRPGSYAVGAIAIAITLAAAR